MDRIGRRNGIAGVVDDSAADGFRLLGGSFWCFGGFVGLMHANDERIGLKAAGGEPLAIQPVIGVRDLVRRATWRREEALDGFFIIRRIPREYPSIHRITSVFRVSAKAAEATRQAGRKDS